MVCGIIILIVLLLPLLSSTLRESVSVLASYIIVILLHQAFALSPIIAPHIYRGTDAMTFQHNAELLVANHIEQAHFYSHFLAFFYRVLGTSGLVGSQLSVLAFSFSCIVFLKLKQVLLIKKYSAISLFVYGALPSLLFFGTTTLREPYEILFFMVATYYGIKILKTNRLCKYILPLILSALALSVTHKGLFFYSILLVGTTIGWYVWTSLISRMRLYITHCTSGFFAITISMTALYLLAVFLSNSYLENIIPDSFVETILTYSDPSLWLDSYKYAENRADYSGLDLSTPAWPVVSGFRLFYTFMFSPFPWQIDNIKDVYAFGEMTVRITLLIAILILHRNSSGRIRVCFSYLICLYFSMVLMWAIGTANYGTAMRHHLVTWWILVLALPFAIDWIKTRVLPCLVPKGKNSQSI